MTPLNTSHMSEETLLRSSVKECCILLGHSLFVQVKQVEDED
jgi:hypothetical protein